MSKKVSLKEKSEDVEKKGADVDSGSADKVEDKAVDESEKKKLNTEAEIRKIEADAKKEVSEKIKKGEVAPAAKIPPVSVRLKDVELKLRKVRNNTDVAMSAFKSGKMNQIRTTVAKVVSWSKSLENAVKNL